MGFWKERNRLIRALDRAGIRYALRAEGERIFVDLHPCSANLARAQAALAEWPAFAVWLAESPRAEQVELANVTMTAALGPATDAERDEEARLIAAMTDDPDDDAPRLVYADRLTARGDPHGELIVMQCARGPEPVKLRNKLNRSWQGFAAEVEPFAEHRPTLRSYQFVRGFVERVFMSVDDFAAHGARVFGAYPTQTLEITDYVPDCARLASVPALALVRRLVLHPVWSVWLAPLAAGAFDRLTHLDLGITNAQDTDRSADDLAFAAKLRAPMLSSIELTNRKTSAIALGVAANPNLPRVRRYREQGQYWSPDEKNRSAAYASLARRCPLEALELDHSNSGIGDDALLPFFASETPAALRVLSLSRTGITDRFLREVARSPKARLLQDVRIHDDAMTVAALRELVHAANGLRWLTVTSQDPEVAALVRSWRPSGG